MANKYLQKLTIDNVEQLIDNVEEYRSVTKNISITSTGTWTEGATTTITKAGIYLIYLMFSFGKSGATGTKSCALGIKRDNVNTQLEFYGGLAANYNNTRSVYITEKIEESQLPVNISVIAMSDKTSGEGLSHLKIVKLTSIVGGG